MAIPTHLDHVEQTYSIDQWRIRTNDVIDDLNDIATKVETINNEIAAIPTTTISGGEF